MRRSPAATAALVLAFFSNLFASLTHYGTAPAPILFGSGHVTLGAWWKIGAIVSVVNIAIWLVVGAAWWRVLGLEPSPRRAGSSRGSGRTAARRNSSAAPRSPRSTFTTICGRGRSPVPRVPGEERAAPYRNCDQPLRGDGKICDVRIAHPRKSGDVVRCLPGTPPAWGRPWPGRRRAMNRGVRSRVCSTRSCASTSLMRRAFEVDVLTCRRCGGRLRLIALIEASAVARRILTHLALPADVPTPAPARAPPIGDDE